MSIEFGTGHVYDKSFNSPSEAEALGLHGLPELVMEGYGFSGGEEEVLAQFREEYQGDGKIIFLIKNQENLVVASLTLNPYFGEICREKAINVNGVVVKPEFRRMGLASRLFEMSVETLKPDLLVGNTKSPSAVLTRAFSLARFGYKTYYGLSNIAPGKLSDTDHGVQKRFLDGYIELKKVNCDDSYAYTVSADLLPSNVPNVKGFPSHLQEAFGPVIKKQLEIGENLTVVMPLISIKDCKRGKYYEGKT